MATALSFAVARVPVFTWPRAPRHATRASSSPVEPPGSPEVRPCVVKDVSTDTTTLFFKSDSAQTVKIVRGTSFTVLTQSFSIGVSPTLRTLVFDHFDQAAPTSWALQRTTDSNWWNDTTGLWQGTKVFNQLPQLLTGRFERDPSKPITVSGGAQTWNLELGNDTGLQGSQIFIGQVDLLEGPFVVDRIATSSSGTVTTVESSKKWVKDVGVGEAQARQRVALRRREPGQARVHLGRLLKQPVQAHEVRSNPRSTAPIK